MDSLDRLVQNIIQDPDTNRLLTSYGLKSQFVSWEDTARSKHSCWGPNISDMTLCVNSHNMPMVRKPNFADISYDMPITTFQMKVGNEGGVDKIISLQELLQNVSTYTGNDRISNLYY